MPSFYQHNHAVFGREVLLAPFMLSAMRARATAVLATAQSLAEAHVDTGDYASSFSITDGVTNNYPTGPRVFARVVNDSPHAIFVEFGWRNIKRFRILGKSLHAVPGDVHAKE